MARTSNAKNTEAKRKTEREAKAASSGDLSLAQLQALVASDPKLSAQLEKSKRASADSERSGRLVKPIQRMTKALQAEIKSGGLTMADVGYLKIESTSDGTVIFALKSTRSRDGTPTERQSITSAMLRDHGVIHFQRTVGKRTTIAESIAKMLDATGMPHYFSDKSHQSNGCTAAGDGWTCGKRGHGDQAQREVLAQLDKLNVAGWKIKRADGTLASVEIMGTWARMDIVEERMKRS